jgi:hypothetical protein
MSSSIALLSENDIDTVLFTVFEIFESHIPGDWYVNLCNPPGGDWSRFALREAVNGTIYTWNTLPRVRGDNKLPDFVVQHNGSNDEQGLIISIESKDKPVNLENEIGLRMNEFVAWLLDEVDPSTTSSPNVTRPASSSYELRSCVATSFQPHMSQLVVKRISDACSCDIAINMYRQGGFICVELYNLMETASGNRLLDLLASCFVAVAERSNLKVVPSR